MGVLQAIVKGFKESPKLLQIVLVFFAFNLIVGLLTLPFIPADMGEQGVGQVPGAPALIISVLSIFVFIFLQGGALGLIRDHLKKNSFALTDFVATGQKYYVRILSLFAIILVVAVVAVVIVALLSAAIMAIADTGFTRALVAAIIFIISVAAAVLLLYPIYAIVVNEIGPIEALKKGIALSLANFWPTTGLLLVLFALTFVVAFLIGLLSAPLIGLLPAGVSRVLTLVVNDVLQSYLSVVMMTALMSYYLGVSSAPPPSAGGPGVPPPIV